MTLESLDRLRDCTWIGGGKVNEYLDEIEREIAERFMELPVDADGLPIHVGDQLNWKYEEEKHVVCAVAPGRVHHWVHGNGKRSTVDCPPTECTHYKPRTVEDVLTDFGNEIAAQGHQVGLTGHEIVMKYADELRDLIKEGEL